MDGRWKFVIFDRPLFFFFDCRPFTFQAFDFQVEPIYFRFQSRYPFAAFIQLLSDLFNLRTKTLLKAGGIAGKKIDLIFISGLFAAADRKGMATGN
jgi:hypothetical protein